MLSLIVAMDKNKGIGLDNKIPWFVPGELGWVAKTTKKVVDTSKRNALIMGHKTWLSLPEERRPLAGRLNIVISRSAKIENKDVVVFDNLLDALSFVKSSDDIETGFVFGGASIYEQVLQDGFDISELLIAIIPGDYDADTFFPDIPEKYKLMDEYIDSYGDIDVTRQEWAL